MGTWMRGGRPSPALLVSVIALVFALTGAASALPGKKTIDKNDLRKNVVKSKTIKNGQVKDADVADLEFAELALLNGWQTYRVIDPDVADPAAAKDAFGFVHLKGALDGDSSSSSRIVRLPSGLRPDHLVYHPVDTSDATYGRVYIYPNGDLYVEGIAAAYEDFTSLEGVSFRAAG